MEAALSHTHLRKTCTPSLPRPNRVESEEERWKPPIFTAGNARSSAAVLRRFFDLQAGSIWRDLTVILSTASGTVLDVGCGAQPYRNLLPAAATYIGIDTTEAKSNFGYEIPDTRYFEGTEWPVENASIDLILCTETLEHILRPDAFLMEARRCLKPDGHIVLTVPFAARWHYIPYDYWRYTPSGLKSLLTEAGFTEIAIYARGGEITVACYKCMALIIPLLLPQCKSSIQKWSLRLLGLLLLPILIVLAVAGNLSLMGQGGDDCLGYTAVACLDIECAA